MQLNRSISLKGICCCHHSSSIYPEKKKNMKIVTINFYAAAILLVLRVFSMPLSAQIVYNPSDSLRLPEVSLGEVQITSTREPGLLGRLPVSAVHLGQQQLQQQHLVTLKQATTMVGNLFMPDYGSRLTSPVYIRGIGSRINAPSVGLYVDHIPYFEKSVFDFDLLNAQRIEVLRGPQGTLYGRNTMGGLISVTSQSPFSCQGTHLMLGGGNPMQFNGQISHYQMLSSRAGVSLSAGISRHEGFFRNEYLGQMADQHLSAGARLRMIWQLTSALSAEFSTHFEHLDQGGYPYAIYDRNTGKSQPVSYNAPSSYERRMNSNGLVMQYETPGLHLRWVSALQYFDDLQSIDQDFSEYDLAFAIQKQQQWMLSQELTIRSRGSGNYQWMTGLFGFSQQLDHDLGIDFGQDAVERGMVPGKLNRRQVSANRLKGAAFFHQSTLEDLLVNNLSLTAGMRLDYEQADLDFESSMHAAFPTPPANAFQSTLSSTEWLPRLALNYGVTSHHLLYAAVVRGYKTGGFNLVFENDQDRSFDPEYSWNYELGYKGEFFGRRAALQSSFFYIDWRNQQIYQMLPSGQGSMLKNAGVSVSRGFELDMQALVTSRLKLNASYGYTHASFRQNKLNPTTDYSGNFIPYVPRYTLFASATYRIPLQQRKLRAVVLNLACRATGTHYWDESNLTSQQAYGLLNTSVSLETRLLTIDVFASNLTSTQYHAFSFSALGNHYVQQGRPATFGINLRYSLNKP